MIKITNKINFSYKSPPKIIAEISGNHCGKKKKFLDLIKSACINGADLIKIQSYEPKDITLNTKKKEFLIKDGIWKNIYLWDLYKKAHTPFSWHEDAFKIAKKYKKIIFSSPFSIRAVDLLEKLGCKLYKIASFEITDIKLINYIASKKKPIIISTGMASKKEINNAINEINKFHNKIIILHCVSSYPTNLKNINLNRINILKKSYKNNMIGMSDHTNDIISSIAAIPNKIVAIEKHYKLNKKTKSADSKFSITPDKLKLLKKYSTEIFHSLKQNNPSVEKISKKLRRSVFAIKDIKRGETLSKENIDTFRPNIGICASKYFEIMGKKLNKSIQKGQSIFEKNLI